MSPVEMVGYEDEFENIWRCIMEEKVGILAVTGKDGVGKTTLLRLIQDKLSSTGAYSIMIWVTVLYEFKVGMFQDEIWRGIGSLDEEWVWKSNEEKAKSIYTVLSQNKFVLFLDHLWDSIDLASVGVPDPRTQNESIVIISTVLDTTCTEMGVQRNFGLDSLTVEAAWALFRMKVGEDILIGDPNIIELAKEMSLLCEGWPILLCIVARAMASRNTYEEWKFALQELKEDVMQGIRSCHGFAHLKFCCDSLPSDVVKFCFLYFCLFPKGLIIPKTDLIDLWISEEFFGNYDGRISALKLGCTVIDTLIRANLFEEENDSIMMSDTILDLGLRIVLKSKMFKNAQLIAVTKVKEYFELVGCNPCEKLGSGKISLMKNIIWTISGITPDVLTFFYHHNPFIMIKDQYIPKLTVLDLSKRPIEEVPRGISELVSLQHLNLSHTYIDRLPVELKKLKMLKCLNLECDDQLRIIPRNVISSLLSLQVLRMFRCGFSLAEDEDNILCATSMAISELLKLKRLKLLSITITCASAFKDFFSTHTLPSITHALSLEVFWGSKSLDISSVAAMEHLITLEIHDVEHLTGINVNYKMDTSFASLREVNVGKCSKLKDLSWLILAPNLAILRVSCCPEMEEIISMAQVGEIPKPDRDPLTKLEVLELESLIKLKTIFWKTLPFQFQKKIEILDCPLLKRIFH